MNTTNLSPIPFSQTEEAFFLSCVGEVMKVWASKSGQAKLNISVENGMADLQLAFKLGLPGDPHLPNHPTHNPRYKTPARKAKDRARAAAHQQAQQHRTNLNSNIQSQQVPLLGHQQQNGAAPAPIQQQAPSAPSPPPQASPAAPQVQEQAAAPADVTKFKADSAPANIAQAATASIHAAPALLQTNAVTVPKKVSAAVPAPPPQEQLSQEAPPNLAVPASQTPRQAPVKIVQDQESTRKMKILLDKADRITMNFTMNHKIAYSNCQHEIEDKFWQIVKEKPSDFFSNDKIDDDKLKEAYKFSARSLGVRIY